MGGGPHTRPAFKGTLILGICEAIKHQFWKQFSGEMFSYWFYERSILGFYCEASGVALCRGVVSALVRTAQEQIQQDRGSIP